jgi:hypothetical protein
VGADADLRSTAICDGGAEVSCTRGGLAAIHAVAAALRTLSPPAAMNVNPAGAPISTAALYRHSTYRTADAEATFMRADDSNHVEQMRHCAGRTVSLALDA